MSDDKLEVKKEEPETSTGSSPAKEKADLKILHNNPGNLTPEAQEEWEKQPEVVTKDGKSEPEVEKTTEGEPKAPELDALELEKQRIAEKREKLLEEIRQGRKENKTLKSEVVEEPETIVDESDDGWKLVDNKIEQRFKDAEARREFYSSHPEFYSGSDGEKNREVVIEFAKTRFRDLSPENLEIAHNHIFGEFDKILAVRDAANKQTNKMLMHQAATLGSGRGKTTIKTAEPPRKRVIPKANDNPASWY